MLNCSEYPRLRRTLDKVLFVISGSAGASIVASGYSADQRDWASGSEGSRAVMVFEPSGQTGIITC